MAVSRAVAGQALKLWEAVNGREGPRFAWGYFGYGKMDVGAASNMEDLEKVAPYFFRPKTRDEMSPADQLEFDRLSAEIETGRQAEAEAEAVVEAAATAAGAVEKTLDDLVPLFPGTFYGHESDVQFDRVIRHYMDEHDDFFNVKGPEMFNNAKIALNMTYIKLANIYDPHFDFMFEPEKNTAIEDRTKEDEDPNSKETEEDKETTSDDAEAAKADADANAEDAEAEDAEEALSLIHI